MKDHQKHTPLQRPSGGRIHAIEFGFIGAPCSVIQEYCHRLHDILFSKLKIGFVDADHQSSSDTSDSFHIEYTDKIDFQRTDSRSTSFFDLRQRFNSLDAVFVNGNHYKSDRQIVFIHEKKRESLQRKLDRLDNIELFILCEGQTELYDFIIEKVGEDHEIPILTPVDIARTSTHISNTITQEIPTLDGLLFMGGKSQRMGKDKSLIEYHGQAQYLYLKQLLNSLCDHVSLSLQTTSSEMTTNDTQIDTFSGLGPYGGILSAFREQPNNAILTLPCDAPFVDLEFVSNLVLQRNPSKFATAFYNPETNFPEPLITIWEPRIYPVLLQFLAMGYSCPRKVLINSDIELIHTTDNHKLFNANTPSEMEWAKKELEIKAIKDN